MIKSLENEDFLNEIINTYHQENPELGERMRNDHNFAREYLTNHLFEDIQY